MEFSTKEEADQAYAKNPTDPETYQAFSRYYSRTYPGETEIGGVDPGLEKLFSDAMAGQSPQQQQSDPSSAEATAEQKAADIKVETVLRDEWGADYEERSQAVSTKALKLFGGNREKLIDFVIATGIDIDPEKRLKAIRFLEEME
jgi:hypothetical protein